MEIFNKFPDFYAINPQRNRDCNKIDSKCREKIKLYLEFTYLGFDEI